jgi:TPR repeat protein
LSVSAHSPAPDWPLIPSRNGPVARTLIGVHCEGVSVAFRWIAATSLLAALTFACGGDEQAPAPIAPEIAALIGRAEAGDPAAQVALGDHFESGDGLPRDDAAALEWYRKAAHQGHLEGQYSFGVMIFTGRGQAEDRTEGAKWIRKSADSGYLDAQNSLAVLYATGGAGEQSHEVSVEWFRKAAEGGHRAAQLSLGARLGEGLGTPKDLKEAAYWLEKAAEGGIPAAQWRYGLVVSRGEGVPKNDVEAYFWLSLSGAARTRDAIEILEAVGANLTEDERDAVRIRMTDWAREHLEP